MIPKNESRGFLIDQNGEKQGVMPTSAALEAGLFKTGGLRGSDRGANYNRFLEIEAELGGDALYAGRDYARCLKFQAGTEGA